MVGHTALDRDQGASLSETLCASFGNERVDPQLTAQLWFLMAHVQSSGQCSTGAMAAVSDRWCAVRRFMQTDMQPHAVRTSDSGVAASPASSSAAGCGSAASGGCAVSARVGVSADTDGRWSMEVRNAGCHCWPPSPSSCWNAKPLPPLPPAASPSRPSSWNKSSCHNIL